jgi:hypothetical protein
MEEDVNKRATQVAPVQPKKTIRHITTREFQTIVVVLTLILAGIAIATGNNESVVWAFLSAVIGMVIGQTVQGKNG